MDGGASVKVAEVGEVMIPAELFVQDVRRLHAYLTDKGVATWMWADMLLSPTEFRESRPGIFTAWPTGTASRFVSNCRAIL